LSLDNYQPPSSSAIDTSQYDHFYQLYPSQPLGVNPNVFDYPTHQHYSESPPPQLGMFPTPIDIGTIAQDYELDIFTQNLELLWNT